MESSFIETSIEISNICSSFEIDETISSSDGVSTKESSAIEENNDHSQNVNSSVETNNIKKKIASAGDLTSLIRLKESIPSTNNNYRSRVKKISISSESDVLSSDDDESHPSPPLRKDSEYLTQDASISTPCSQVLQQDSVTCTADISTKKINVTPVIYNEHVAEIRKISEKISQFQSLLKHCSQLPDNGYKLKTQLAQLNKDLADKQNYLQFLKVIEPVDLVNDFQQLTINKTPSSNTSNYFGRDWDSLLKEFNSPNNDSVIDTISGLLSKMNQSLETMPSSGALIDQPSIINGNLMTHQREALAWMIWREQQFPKGGILGDDMGLGKTLTMISLIAWHIEMRKVQERQMEGKNLTPKCRNKSGYNGRTLVVCPVSVIKQWESEINKFTSHNLSVLVHHGDKRSTSTKELTSYEIVLTTYGIVKSECDKNGVLFKIDWERIILDEAHTIRNHTSRQSLDCCRLKGTNKWALTGTPIQNKESDVFALLKFLGCHPFDQFSTFKRWISTKAKLRVSLILKFLLLRRTKSELLEYRQIESLPEKKTEIIQVQLHEDEMSVYQLVLAFSKSLFKRYLEDRDPQSKYSEITDSYNELRDKYLQKALKLFNISGSISVSHILLVILRLRQICIHPSLISTVLIEEDVKDVSDEEQLDLLDRQNELRFGDVDNNNQTSSSIMNRSNPVFNPNRLSSKFQSVLNVLQKKVIDRQEKAIIVSQFTSVLKLFQNHLSDRKIGFLTLTGETKIAQRKHIVESFNKNSDEQILLLSMTAGGVGLNLCGANHLFLIDPHWNPQLEIQAEDRIYRIGQKKPVTIYRFICRKTIEQRIENMQELKKEMATNILSGSDRNSKIKLTVDDMGQLLY